MPSTPLPKQIAEEAIKQLKSVANSRTARQAKTYFKPGDEVWIFGVDTPSQRKIAAELYRRVNDGWTINDALAFCDILIEKREMEAKNIGIFLLARYKKSFEESLLPNIERWLANDHCNNWAATDALCMEILAPLVRQHPVLIPKLKSWTVNKNLWVRRASVVGMLHCARRGEHLADVYAIAESLFKYPEDLIHKATGWVLREAGKSDSERLENFLLERGPKIPRTALRYAIERFSPEKRKVLLEETKRSRSSVNDK
jgi:3-methyladenine DNA glycosylase AlkD